jgi:phage gp29-like protein
MATAIYGRKDNAWREHYNPLRGLTLTRVVALLESGERGQYADLQWMYYYMERTDPVVFSVLQRRRSALLDCDWDVRRVVGTRNAERGVRNREGSRLEGSRFNGSVSKNVSHKGTAGTEGGGAVAGLGDRWTAGPFDPGLAAEQEACLREVYEGIENFKDAVGFLFTGLFRGFAHVEKHYGVGGVIERLEPVEQWFWVRDGMFGEWEYNENAVSGRRYGVAIDRRDFVILESDALDRMLSVLYLRRVVTQRDWDAYLGVYGIPPVFLVGPPGASVEKEREYQAIAEQLFSNGRGYLPNGTDVKYVNGGGGRAPFKELLDYLDKQILLVGTGGLLTMLSESGSGTLAGGAHKDTFKQIARGDALLISSQLQQDIDLPVLSKAFPDKPVLAYFQFAPSVADQDRTIAEDAAQLALAGYAVDPAALSEKLGYKVERVGGAGETFGRAGG